MTNSHRHRILRLVKLIHHRRQISRSGIIENTGYSAFTVSRLCDELMRGGYICEAGQGDSTGGRPPALLSISPGLGRLLGLHVGTVNARIAVIDTAGNILAYTKVPSRVREGPEAAIPHLTSVADALLRQAGVSGPQLLGVGVGIAGVLERSTGTTLLWPKVPQWRNVPVKKIMTEHFAAPVAVDDCPRTMALAERWLGDAGNARNFIYVMLGAGAGSALFLNGELYTGSGGFAGEFGHISLDQNGPVCSCGNRGCIESLVSASSVIAEAQRAVSDGLAVHLWDLCGGQPENISIELIAQAAAENDRFSSKLLAEAGVRLGAGIVGLVNLFNPELIVLGGAMALAASEQLLTTVRQVVSQKALPGPVSQVDIRVSRLSECDWARGAAYMATESALERLLNARLVPDP